MKRHTALPFALIRTDFLFLFLFLLTPALSAWEPAENVLMTPWGETVTPENAWQGYPRPQLVRDNYGKWQNLNGLWVQIPFL